jgi:hypothetical protein
MIAAVADKVSQGEEFKDFSEFFNLWITVNEKAYSALFKTRDYAKMQGEVLEASLNVRKHFFKLAELHLYDLPIALRSEMDDLYKTSRPEEGQGAGKAAREVRHENPLNLRRQDFVRESARRHQVRQGASCSPASTRSTSEPRPRSWCTRRTSSSSTTTSRRAR